MLYLLLVAATPIVLMALEDQESPCWTGTRRIERPGDDMNLEANASDPKPSRRPAMNLFELWWTAVTHPARAFEEVKRKPAPTWGFRVVLCFNLMISLTSLLALELLGRQPFLPSWLTFLPTERYYQFEIFFLPVLRMVSWLLSAATIHLGLRLMGRPSDMDRILNIGGVQYLVVLPYTFAVDWTAIALNAYGFGLIAVLHGAVDLIWSLTLGVIGLRVLLGLKPRLAVELSLLSTVVSLPLLAIFAR